MNEKFYWSNTLEGYFCLTRDKSIVRGREFSGSGEKMNLMEFIEKRLLITRATGEGMPQMMCSMWASFSKRTSIIVKEQCLRHDCLTAILRLIGFIRSDDILQCIECKMQRRLKFGFIYNAYIYKTKKIISFLFGIN